MPGGFPTNYRASVKAESAGCVECSNVRTLPPFIICLWYAHNPVRSNASHAPGIFYKLYASTLPLFLGNAPFPWKLHCCVICGKGEARRVQPDYKHLYLYQSPEQAFALGLSPPWEGARGRNRKTRKAYFAFVVFHGRGSEWYTKYHPSPMQQQHTTQHKNNMRNISQ